MLIDGFNKSFNNIAAIYIKVGEESTSMIRFWTTPKGNLTHLSYIFRKPESLGIDFKTVPCSVTGALVFIKIHRWKEGTNNSK